MATYTGSDKRLQYLFQNGGGGSSTLAGLSDVDLTSPTDGQVLKYDANNDEWINANESGGGGGTNVEANPQGTPTDWLNSLKVGNLIYSVAKVGDCYSTTERQVGCWADGKPLYQKTYIFTSGSSQGWTVVDASPSNVDYIQVIECMVGGYSAGAAIAASACIFPYASASSIEVYCSSGYTNKSGTITVQYTKTTDTAGSGIWTPSGAYAEHYSETEHIVGTWIDGSTLYEKTFVQQLSGNTAHIDISAYNMKKAFIYGGFYDIGVTMQSLCEWIGANAYSWAHINTGSQYLYIDCYNSVASNSTIYVTVRYTKNS